MAPKKKPKPTSAQEKTAIRNHFLGYTGEKRVIENLELSLLNLEAVTFKRTGGPLHLLKCLVLADQQKVYPPIEVLASLAGSVQQFLESAGKKNLQQCLGIFLRCLLKLYRVIK